MQVGRPWSFAARVDGAAGPQALGAKGSVRDRLTPPGRAPGSRPRELYSIAALARYGAFGAISYAAFGGENLYNRPVGRRKCNPPLEAGATTLPGGKHVTGFSVAYGSLRIQFLCHPRKRGHYGCLAMEPCLYRKA